MMNKTFELADKLGYESPFSNSLSEDKLEDQDVISYLQNTNYLNIKVVIKWVYSQEEYKRVREIPKDGNQLYIYMHKKPNVVLLKKRVSLLRYSGVVFSRDVEKVYGLTIGNNLKKAIEAEEKGKITYAIADYILEIIEVKDSNHKNAFYQMIFNHVTEYPSDYEYSPPTGFEEAFKVFQLCLELGFIDLDKYGTYAVNKVFTPLASWVRSQKLNEAYWNPNVEDTKYNEETKPNTTYTPLIPNLSKLEQTVTKKINEIKQKERVEIELRFKDNKEFPGLADLAISLPNVIDQIIDYALVTILKHLKNQVTELDHYIKKINAFIVGMYNGLLELIAGIIEGIGFVIGALFSYEYQKTLIATFEKTWEELSFSTVVDLIIDGLKDIFAFLVGNEPYKNAYEFGEALFKIAALIIDAVFFAKSVGKILNKVKAILNKLEIFVLLKLDKKLLKSLTQKGVDIEIEPIYTNAGQLSSGVPIKIPDGKKINIKYKGVLLETFTNEKDANKFLKKLDADEKLLEDAFVKAKSKLKLSKLASNLLDKYVDEALIKWRDIERRPGAVAILEGNINGKTIQVINYTSKGIAKSVMRGRRHPLVDEWLQFISKENYPKIYGRPTHGRCAEPINISEWLFKAEEILKIKKGTMKIEKAKEIFQGVVSKAKSVHNNKRNKLAHGLHKSACDSCNPLLEYFGIIEIN